MLAWDTNRVQSEACGLKRTCMSTVTNRGESRLVPEVKETAQNDQDAALCLQLVVETERLETGSNFESSR